MNNKIEIPIEAFAAITNFSCDPGFHSIFLPKKTLNKKNREPEQHKMIAKYLKNFIVTDFYCEDSIQSL